MSWFLVFIGGGLGSILRFGASKFILNHYGGVLPVATLVSNVLSCIVLALIVSYHDSHGVENRFLRTAVVIGFCGGFSTFSTFSYETIQLIKNGNHMVAVGNVIVSVVVCLILIYKLTK